MNGYHKTTNESYQEIWKLQEMLEKAKIPYEFEPLFDGWHILYPDSVKTECSVIEHLFSYKHDLDLLEIIGLLTPSGKKCAFVRGSRSAKKVFNRIQSHQQNFEEQ